MNTKLFRIIVLGLSVAIVLFSVFFYTHQMYYVKPSGASNKSLESVINANSVFPINDYSRLPLIAIIDSGIYLDNPYINKTNIAQIVLDDISEGSNKIHGTMVAGLIAANGDGSNTPKGMLPNAKILSIQAGTDIGMSPHQLSSAINIAVEKGAKVINVSSSTYESSKELEESVKAAISKGVVIVAAAGNNDKSVNGFPAAYQNVIAVSTINENGELSYKTNFDQFHHIAAPGDKLLTTANNKESPLTLFSGSSAATPIVTSVCTAILSKEETWTSKEINSLLNKSAKIKTVGDKKINILDVKRMFELAHKSIRGDDCE
ncbi:S8 family serine peptidase [Paenibacillus larvae]|uniref:S8 family peptidase n=2 Tax=Paenibacillus larvae TaxID=1464 RepID=UPI002282468D|nr:S8 family serine peptidase [Paenibacillus larvae]MCY9508473.1 S8 family serine peptidase [Paenibacillus larvae]MCY9523827.1 S8 family serine peptidase [Paenibacillus larvae]